MAEHFSVETQPAPRTKHAATARLSWLLLFPPVSLTTNRPHANRMYRQALHEEASKLAALRGRIAAYEEEDAPARRAREALLRRNKEASMA